MTGKVALVTGSSAGIGLVTALAFGRQDATVVLADVNDAQRDKIEAELAGAGAEAMFVRTDVSRPTDVAALAEATIARSGGSITRSTTPRSRSPRPPPTPPTKTGTGCSRSTCPACSGACARRSRRCSPPATA
jgi:NAD(P)-dependent dehydrogenase (short-subunit alcohol dehydrogenase family)